MAKPIEFVEVLQGDLSPIWEIGLNPETSLSSPDWECKLIVRSESTGTVVLEKDITLLTDDNFRFRAHLDPEETEALSVGNYKLGIQLKNFALTPRFRKEEHRFIKIVEQVVTTS